MTFFSSLGTPHASGAASKRSAFLAGRNEGHFWMVGLCELLRASASPASALANPTTTTTHLHDLLVNHLLHLGLLSWYNANTPSRKPPNSARVPSSTRGFLTSSRPSVSVVSPSISLSGSSRPPSTTSPSLVCRLLFIFTSRPWLTPRRRSRSP